MSDIANFWRINEFSEKVNEVFKKDHPKAKTHKNTIAIWFNELEERGIHYVNRDNTRPEWKVFDEVDLEIALFIFNKRYKSSNEQVWNLPAIYDIVPQECEVRPFPMSHEVKTDSLQLDEIMSLVKKQLAPELSEIIERNQAQQAAFVEKQTKFFLEQEKAREQSQRKTLVDMLEFQSEARKKAISEWESLPADKRFNKRLFFKEEKWAEREKFIADFIEKETLYWLNKND